MTKRETRREISTKNISGARERSEKIIEGEKEGRRERGKREA